jgi:hypothetical protein
MIRVRLHDLELARRDPRAYIRKLKEPKPKFGIKSKHAVLLLSVYRFHKYSGGLFDQFSGDLTGALKYFDTLYEKKKFKQNPASKQLYQEQLTTYAQEFGALKADVVKYKDNLILALPDEFKGKIEVYGQIPRVDLNLEGYSVWLFDKSAKNWREEIRFPIIQAEYAKKFSADLEEVKVGVYDFSSASYMSYSFTEDKVKEAETLLYGLLRQLITLNSRTRNK